LITRYYPRGVRREHFDKWVRELAPSKDLLEEYKNGDLDWKKFQLTFKEQMRTAESKEILSSLADIAKNRNVTLLCYEKNEENCHRHIVQNLILNNSE
jgi:uncharacterized protein YeaO (DUF488 family)